MIYYFSIADVVLQLDSDRELSVSHRFSPFLVNGETPHYTIIIRCTQQLPPVPENCITRGGTQTVLTEETETIFYTLKAGETPSIQCILGSHRAELFYKPAVAEYFADVGDVFHWIPMESLLLRQKVLVLHAALVSYAQHGILLCGPSGVGKSTQAALWEQIGASIRNGDRALLRKVDGKWETWGAPFAGTSGIYESEKSQLSLVALLEQGETPAIAPLTANGAMKFLYPETAIHHWDRNFVEQATDLLLSLSNEVPLYRLTCTPNMETVTLLERQLWHPFP